MSKILVENPTIGSDVEFFLQHKETLEIVSAEGFIKGTKENPFRFMADNPYYGMQLDNVLAEGNIPPAESAEEFCHYLNFLRGAIDSAVPQEFRTVAIPAARLDFKYLQTENAKTFGCDPSNNCWTGETVQPQPTGDNLRSAGFHVHIGYDMIRASTNIALARACDLFLGVPAVLVEPENERKKVGYGCAGNFRHQRHGVEYRSLSSFFASEDRYIQWAFQNALIAVESVNKRIVLKADTLGAIVQEAINTENKELAEKLVSEFNIPLP